MAMTWKGEADVRAKIKAIAQQYPRRIAGALYRRAGYVMTDSQANYVPVDLAALRDSGFVLKPVRTGPNISVVLGFGGPASAYAIAVHEHPSSFDPPSWKGTQVTFSPSGHGPKYLEKPLYKAAATLQADLARDLAL
jgi:hypothetical protein